jgi:hypothetical protein
MTKNETPNAERVHHPFSPSKLQFLEACPCYESRSSTNERAIAGTLAHGVTETHEDDYRLSDDDAAAAAECMDFYEREANIVREARERAIIESAHRAFGDHEPTQDEWDATFAAHALTAPPVIELTETYLPVDDCWLTLPDGKKFEGTTAGYVDRAIIDHTGLRAIMFDWKFGAWPVEGADNNLQGIAYSLGLFRLYPTLQEIKFYFKQPALNSISSAMFTRAQVSMLYCRVQCVVARAAEARNSKTFNDANPMVPVCNFCSNIGRCPKVMAIACNIAHKFSPLQVPENITPTFADKPENTAVGLNLSAVMKVWAEAYRECVTARVIRREAVVPPGFTLATRAPREVADSAKAHAVCLHFMTEAEYNALCELPGFGALEKVISSNAPRGQKTAKIDEFKKALADSGAVVVGQSYAFLRAAPTAHKEKTIEGDTE